MKQLSFVLIIFIALLGFGSPAYAQPGFGTKCYSCHSDTGIAPPVTPPTGSDAKQDHSNPPYNNSESCMMCHAGNGWELTDPNPPVVDEPVVDEPVVDEPVVDEPVVDEPVVDEPVVDEPVVDEPVVDEPVVDEPGTGNDCSAGGTQGCNSETTCDPCKWTRPCGPAYDPPADSNIDVKVSLNACTTPHIIKIGAKGYVKVVINGNSKLNVRTIDTGSILFADAKPVKFYLERTACDIREVDPRMDMVLIFRRCDLSLDANTTEITLTGKTLSGASITGSAIVKLIDCSR